MDMQQTSRYATTLCTLLSEPDFGGAIKVVSPGTTLPTTIQIQLLTNGLVR